MARMERYLDLVNACDSFPYQPSEAYLRKMNGLIHFRIAAFPELTLGYLLPFAASELEKLPGWKLDLKSAPPTVTLVSGDDVKSRSKVMEQTIIAMRGTRHFKILETWRNELFGVYGEDGQELFHLERSATKLFGVVTFGVHMTAYRRNRHAKGGMEIWVPKRSRTKSTYPGMLDNSVAGGISAGEEPFESLIREGEEEASLSAHVMTTCVAVGAVTYFSISGCNSGGDTGLMQPECQLVYDLDLTEQDVELRPNDNEVEAFELMDLVQVEAALECGKFKPNCALVMLDFLIRHGRINASNEPGYFEIVSRLHRRLEFPLPNFTR